MQKWEYLTCRVAPETKTGNVLSAPGLEEMKRRGKEGWELVSVAKDNECGSSEYGFTFHYWTLFFKRPLE
jgi:hypothetical protein